MHILLIVVAALLIGLTLGAVGGGGSILAVPVLVGIAGLSVTEATTASLIVVGTAAVIGLVASLRSATVRMGIGITFGVAGIGGAVLGTQLNRGLDEGVLLIAFAGLMAIVAARMAMSLLTTPTTPTTPAVFGERGVLSLPGSIQPATALSADGSLTGGAGDDIKRHVDLAEANPGAHGTNRDLGSMNTGTVVRVLLAGTLVGFLTGLFGVGGGFVIVPALMFLLAFDIRSATATSLLVISINSAVALAMRADVSTVDWGVVAPFTALAVAGVLLGRRGRGSGTDPGAQWGPDHPHRRSGHLHCHRRNQPDHLSTPIDPTGSTTTTLNELNGAPT